MNSPLPDRGLIGLAVSLIEREADRRESESRKRPGRNAGHAASKTASPRHPMVLARTLTLIEALAGNVIEGMRLSPLAMKVGESASVTLRDLQALESLGYAERIPGRSDCWRLTSRICRIATAHRDEMSRQRARLDDIDRNYTLPPNY